MEIHVAFWGSLSAVITVLVIIVVIVAFSGLLKLLRQRKFVFFHEDKVYLMKDAKILLRYRYRYGTVANSSIYLVRFEDDDENYLYFRIEFDSATDREPTHKYLSLEEMRKELQHNAYRNPKRAFSSLNNECIEHL